VSGVLRAGVDLVSVSRLGNLVREGDPGFTDAVWTATEQRSAAGDPRRLAGRWGVKEAMMKALGAGWPDIAWTEIEVVGGPGEQLSVELTGGAASVARGAGVELWAISVSYEGDLAMAFAVGTGTGAR